MIANYERQTLWLGLLLHHGDPRALLRCRGGKEEVQSAGRVTTTSDKIYDEKSLHPERGSDSVIGL